jgi:hypothetical protein
VGRQCVHGHILSACLPFCQRFQRAGSQNPRFSQSCARPICKPFLRFFFMNCFTSKARRDSAYVAVVTLLWLSIPLFSFSRSSFAGEEKGLNLIHFLTWRKTRTKNLKTTEFLELCGRVLSLILSRYVSDSIWTIVKISWVRRICEIFQGSPIFARYSSCGFSWEQECLSSSFSWNLCKFF